MDWAAKACRGCPISPLPTPRPVFGMVTRGAPALGGGPVAAMVGEEGSAVERAPSDDSSSVVLHARWTVLLMLIASTLVAVEVLAEDDTRLNRALQGAEVVTGLMSLWHAGQGSSRARHARHCRTGIHGVEFWGHVQAAICEPK